MKNAIIKSLQQRDIPTEKPSVAMNLFLQKRSKEMIRNVDVMILAIVAAEKNSRSVAEEIHKGEICH